MEATPQYTTKAGDGVYIKDDLTTGQFWMVQKLAKNKRGGVDEEALQIQIIKLQIIKIVTKEGREITERVEVINFIKSMSAKDWVPLSKKLMSFLSGDEDEDGDDPKEITSD
jgi:hypothetical protein